MHPCLDVARSLIWPTGQRARGNEGNIIEQNRRVTVRTELTLKRHRRRPNPSQTRGLCPNLLWCRSKVDGDDVRLGVANGADKSARGAVRLDIVPQGKGIDFVRNRVQDLRGANRARTDGRSEVERVRVLLSIGVA
jgi:hypothetical protein